MNPEKVLDLLTKTAKLDLAHKAVMVQDVQKVMNSQHDKKGGEDDMMVLGDYNITTAPANTKNPLLATLLTILASQIPFGLYLLNAQGYITKLTGGVPYNEVSSEVPNPSPRPNGVENNDSGNSPVAPAWLE